MAGHGDRCDCMLCFVGSEVRRCEVCRAAVPYARQDGRMVCRGCFRSGCAHDGVTWSALDGQMGCGLCGEVLDDPARGETWTFDHDRVGVERELVDARRREAEALARLTDARRSVRYQVQRDGLLAEFTALMRENEAIADAMPSDRVDRRAAERFRENARRAKELKDQMDVIDEVERTAVELGSVTKQVARALGSPSRNRR